MRYHEVILESELQTFYHGTLADRIPSILKKGLIPATEASPDNRWATLGGVYLTSQFDYAVKAAQEHSDGAPIAVITVRVPSLKHATPDEDVVEKALIKAYTSSLDDWGVDDAYDCDLDHYARQEEERPQEPDEAPFDREAFFKDFWASVMQTMSRLAGTPRRSDPALVSRAVNLALEVVEQDAHEQWSGWQAWQSVKNELIATYPRLRNSEQHAKSGVSTPYNIRFTKRILPRQIVSVVRQDADGWQTVK